MRNGWLLKNRENVDTTYRVFHEGMEWAFELFISTEQRRSLVVITTYYWHSAPTPILCGSCLARVHENVSILEGFLAVFAQQLKNQPQ